MKKITIISENKQVILLENRDYWLNRKVARNNLSIQEENALLQKMFKLLEECYEETVNNLYAFYGKFADEEGAQNEEK